MAKAAYEIRPVYQGLDAVFFDGNCIGVVIPSREWQSPYKRIFFCYEEAKSFYGVDCESAVNAYFAAKGLLEVDSDA